MSEIGSNDDINSNECSHQIPLPPVMDISLSWEMKCLNMPELFENGPVVLPRSPSPIKTSNTNTKTVSPARHPNIMLSPRCNTFCSPCRVLCNRVLCQMILRTSRFGILPGSAFSLLSIFHHILHLLVKMISRINRLLSKISVRVTATFIVQTSEDYSAITGNLRSMQASTRKS